ncbi:hypothetical protein QTG56_24260 (plasmid) [Rossellomorea sp. AcN35-11]|nr:hypothetical protein QTG56_24260 [Rossellomorea sp. AcN35-11]
MTFEQYIEDMYDIDFKDFEEEFSEEARKKIHQKYLDTNSK